MKKHRIVAWVLGLLVVPVLAWIIVGIFFTYRVSQREEARHAKFREACEPQLLEAWQDLEKKKAWLTWKYRTPEFLYYEVRLYPDRRWSTLVRYKTATVQPDRFAQGKASPKAWAALMEALKDSQHLDHRDPKKIKEARVSIVFNPPGLEKGWVSFHTRKYSQLNPAVRKLDEAIALVIADAALKPPRRYARVAPAVNYTVANLARGLETDRTEAFPHIVGHLTAIGKPALPEMERVLKASRPGDTVSRERIKALIDGLETFPDAHARVLPKIREIAAEAKPNRRVEASTQRAAKFVKDKVIRQYRQEAFARLDLAFTPPADPPSDDLRRQYDAVRARYARKRKADWGAMTRELAALGPGIYPLLLENLPKWGGYQETIALVDTLAVIGGPDAILFAIKQEELGMRKGVESLVKLDDAGLPALLILVEFGDTLTRSSITGTFAKKPAYRAAVPQIHEMLERHRRAYRETKDEVLRQWHRETVRTLISQLMALAAQDPGTVQCLVATALDMEQHDSNRKEALALLRRIGAPAAAPAVDQLRKQQGYESGAMRGYFSKTVKALSGEA